MLVHMAKNRKVPATESGGADETKKSVNLNVRCTPAQKAELEEVAKHLGIPISAFVIMVSLEAAREKKKTMGTASKPSP
jgi:hypothetical protein